MLLQFLRCDMLSMNKNKSVVKLAHVLGDKNLVSTVLLGLVVLALAIGCSSSEQASSASAETVKPESSTALTPIANDGSVKIAAPTVARAVVRKGSLTVRVPEVEKAEKEVNRYASANGGFVSQSESSDLSTSSPTISMTVRVPVRLFESSIETFESMGTRLEKKTNGEDVTAKIVDYDARLKTMLAQEDSFRNMLRKTERSTEALDLQTRLMKLREDIESMQAQRKVLADTAALSTIDLTLVGEAKPAAALEDKGWFAESWNTATGLFSGLSRTIGSFVVFLVVFSPFWGSFAAFVWWLVRREKAKQKAA